MYQSEAMWIAFSGDGYPFAVKIAAGKIGAATGKPWSADLGEQRQNYVVIPTQPWLDGFCVREGVIRQFVAMPLGAGYTAEEQITGQAEYDGLQIQVYPMRPEIYGQEIKSKRLKDRELCFSLPPICKAEPVIGITSSWMAIRHYRLCNAARSGLGCYGECERSSGARLKRDSVVRMTPRNSANPLSRPMAEYPGFTLLLISSSI